MCNGASYQGKQMWEDKQKDDMKKYGYERTNYFENDRDFFKRVGKLQQKEVDRQAAENTQLIASQQAQSRSMQSQMVQQQAQQERDSNELAELQSQKVTGMRRSGDAVVSSLQILGQQAPEAPTASQTETSSKKKRVGATKASISRGSARSRGVNLSI